MTGVVFARSVSDEAISLSIGLTHHGVTKQVSLLNLHSWIKDTYEFLTMITTLGMLCIEVLVRNSKLLDVQAAD